MTNCLQFFIIFHLKIHQIDHRLSLRLLQKHGLTFMAFRDQLQCSVRFAATVATIATVAGIAEAADRRAVVVAVAIAVAMVLDRMAQANQR